MLEQVAMVCEASGNFLYIHLANTVPARANVGTTP